MADDIIEARQQAAITVIRGLALVLVNGRTYGMTHRITRKVLTAVSQALTMFHKAYGPLSFEVRNDIIFVEGNPITVKSAGIDEMAKLLLSLHANDMTFDVGLNDGDVEKWFELVSNPVETELNADGFGAVLVKSGLSKIRSGNFRLQKVAADEIVAKKTEVPAIGKQRNATPIRTAQRLLDSLPDGVEVPAMKINLDDAEIFEDLKRVAMPPAELDAKGPESVANEAIKRLERFSDGLMAYQPNQTQKNRKTLRKLLKSAETDIAQRLERLGADIQAVERLATKVKELVEDIAVDGIVARYVKLKSEINENENRITRRIRKAQRIGGDNGREIIGKQLLGAGLTQQMLNELVDNAIQSKQRADSGGNGGLQTASGGNGAGAGNDVSALNGKNVPDVPVSSKTSETTNQLTSLLSHLKTIEPGSGELPALVENILGEMNKSLKQTEERANEQLATLKRITMIPSDRRDASALSTKEILQMMAELGQQLKQPLTVVAGAVDMINLGYFGKVSQQQEMPLDMISQSAVELTNLIERLVKIAGVPTSLKPGEENIFSKIDIG